MVRNLLLLGAFAAVGVSGATNEVPRKGSSTKPVTTTRGATKAPRHLPRAASGQRKSDPRQRKSGAEAAESGAGVKKRRQPTEASGDKGRLVHEMPSDSELPELVRTLHLAIYHGKTIDVNWGVRSKRWARAELRKLKGMWDEANSIEQHRTDLVDAVIAGSVSKDALDGQLPIVVNRLTQLRNEYRNLPLAAIVAMALKNTLPSVEEALTNEETALASLFTPQAILGACRSIISSSYPAASSSYPASAVSFAAVRVIGSSLVDFDSEKTDQALESVLRAVKREEVTGIMSRILDLMGRNEPKLMKLSTDSTKLDTDSTKLSTDSTKLPRGGQSEDGLEGDSLHPSESEETRHCSGETRYCSGETRYYSPLAVQYVQMYLAFDYVASDVDGPLNLSLEVLEGLLAGKDETHTAFLRRLGPWGSDRLKARIAIMRSTEGHDAISELYLPSKDVSGRELTNMVKYNAELLQRGAVDSHLARELITRIVPYDPLDRYRVKLIEEAWTRLQNDCRVQQAAAKVEPHIIYWKGVDAARKAILECPWVERSWKTLNLVDHDVDPKMPYGVTSDHIRQACVELGHEFHEKNAEKHKRFYRYLAQHEFNYL